MTPTDGSTVPMTSVVTISGTATDSGGGLVAGVEVSVDGGATWRRANGPRVVDLQLADQRRRRRAVILSRAVGRQRQRRCGEQRRSR